MKIERQPLHGGGLYVPSILLTPHDPIGAAVITHGYGGCKEEQLGLAWRVAETGLVTCAIDLRGHGENEHVLDEDVHSDVETAIQYCRRFGKVVAIGHSLGGRLSLLSSADFAVGISPALSKTFSTQTQEALKAIRGYRVREISPNVNFEILNKLPEWRLDDSREVQILFGSRDVPEIISACNELRQSGVPVMQINKALHNDIFLSEETFEKVTNRMKEWL